MGAQTIDNTLGAAFVGNIAAAIHSFTSNNAQAIACCLSLRMCDTVHLALITHGIYFYAITNFSNPAALQNPTLTIMSVSDLTIRFVFGHRLWKLSGGNILLAFVIFQRSIRLKTFANFAKISYLLYLAFASAVVADALIASSLCIMLAKKRTGFRKTDTIVNILMMYTINTGLITGLNKLYFNSLLATLNARANLRERTDGGISSIPMAGIVTSRSDIDSGKAPTSPRIAVTIQKFTDREAAGSDEAKDDFSI
ncbi:hypothetical protein PILCRDRAFT_91424 [Piloderma croceum F 1598]|uniref:DUF6534 domain-containing protein n=1 Tax=Piloderma croceum (strain F 1598) TaxID=765440 RepID=A0A0C3AS89_PILCF|nr:hypothetical protein PILCRDRAFT_91424 [Piloderma croceum F 1598]